MVDVILYSFLASFFLIFLGIGIYIRYRKNISKIAIEEKINGLKTHIKKYRFWYFGIACIVLISVFYYLWDVFFNPHRINYFPMPNVPPPQIIDNEENFLTSFRSLVIYALITLSRCFPVIIFLFSFVLLMLGPRIFKHSKYGFLFQSLTGITSSISMFYLIIILVANLFIFVYLILSFSGVF